MSDDDDVQLLRKDLDTSNALNDTMKGIKVMKFYVSYSRFYRAKWGQWLANAALFTGFLFIVWIYGADYMSSCDAVVAARGTATTAPAGSCPWVTDTTYAKGCGLTTHECGWAQNAAGATQYHLLAIPFYFYFGFFWLAAFWAWNSIPKESPTTSSDGKEQTIFLKFRELLISVLVYDILVCTVWIIAIALFCEYLGTRDIAVAAGLAARDTAIAAFLTDVGATDAQTVDLAAALLLVAAAASTSAKTYYLASTIMALVITGIVLMGHSYRVTNSKSISEEYGIGNSRREMIPLKQVSSERMNEI